MFTLESVRAEIEAAFGDLPVPDAEKLIGPFFGGAENEKFDQELRSAFANKHWRELDESFLRKHSSFLYFLSDEGYRFYLPALLMRSLHDFRINKRPLREENECNASSLEMLTAWLSLTQITLYDLRPGYYDIYMYGEDKEFSYRTSLFTAQQYGAVCSFFGLAFETFEEEKFRIAKILWWAWNREPHSARDMAFAFYDTMHHYQWPETENPAARRVIEQIREAFNDRPYPPIMDTNEDDARDNEDTEIKLEYRGQNWRTLHPEFLGQHRWLVFLPYAGFRYFLPAFLIDALADGHDGPRFYLTDGIADERRYDEYDKDEEDNSTVEPSEIIPYHQTYWYQHAMELFADFTVSERQAVAAFIQFQIDQINEGNDRFGRKIPEEYNAERRRPWEQALERFWAL